MSTFKPSTEDKSGKVVYNAGIVKGIVALAVNEVKGTLPLTNNKGSITLFLEKEKPLLLKKGVYHTRTFFAQTAAALFSCFARRAFLRLAVWRRSF